METIDCSCKGVNPSCNKCFGRGYYDEFEEQKSLNHLIINTETKNDLETQNLKNISFESFSENLTANELEINVKLIIIKIDLLSQKMIQILNTISFRKSSYKTQFGNKLQTLRIIERERNYYKKNLSTLIKCSEQKKIKLTLNFKHFLSDTTLNVDSAKELKHIRRLCNKKRLKN